MEVMISRTALLKGLQRVQGIVEKRNTMPILAHVLVETVERGITLFATDLELGVRGAYSAAIKSPGSVTVSARKLFEIVRELPEDDVLLSSEENHWIRVECGRSRFKVAGLPPGDFPVFPGIGQETMIPLNRDAFLDLTKRTLFAVGENDARYVLNGVLCAIESGTLRMVGTDGHRLAVSEHVLDRPKNVPPYPDVTAIVPKKALLEMKKLVEDGESDSLEIGFTKTQFFFRQGDLVLLTRLMEGNYPNYHQVVPVGNDKRVVVDKKTFEGALRRVSLLAKERTNAIKFQLEPARVLLSTSNPELGEAKEDLAVSYDGEGLATGFNARYLLDVLGAVSGPEAVLEFKDALSPCLIREPGQEGSLCVIMPMRV
jgi:DNA polymerase-3 subunit beta